ncbi:OsmC family protein [Actinomyces slackii]|uniref:OsmC-like protein n=1 Tax=Actinomyces slackii TaxID=52774 RepID=A0A448KCK3_9ACTO|nr:OsmC family protein [Actinomyces slackii]VEG74653.1 OsmC-like protein [Actinomyces slackii]
MSANPANHTDHADPTSPRQAAPGAVWAERTGTRQYIGRNSKGAEVRVGMGPGEFSPGELMKIALATCNTLSADHRLAKALGEGFTATVGCSSVKNEAEERYESFQVEIVTDLSGLEDSARQTLTRRVEAAIERGCTVGHTIEQGATITMELVDPDED